MHLKVDAELPQPLVGALFKSDTDWGINLTLGVGVYSGTYVELTGVIQELMTMIPLNFILNTCVLLIY